ncbi:Xaa-Pro aminopeptidase family enzyme [Myxococcus stipitatus DSM 14675]|uniref:Xaa-Pro aminopeptidase family enzyme n=1 Tax=Myxococcus stipitatus (strain DSM 14675 / JCM 12634 / Mx s8) TaxID=1278073 RepID=L7UJX5_MYXSD|nr:M24 family metallopeptidase [Myxococcus stipitatus]AGC46754.1 Xaa-Pro aminopeptidase family enzyme [Myxococcus stipitatus DSM 14675]
MTLLKWAVVPLVLLSACSSSRKEGAGAEPHRLLPLSQQLALRQTWLEKRHGMLLEMMRRHGVGMWIIVNEEFHDDPLTQFVAPPLPYAGNRDIFVFVDAGADGLRRVALTGYGEEALQRFFEIPTEGRSPAEFLAELDARHQPQRIALSTGGKRGVTRSLTRDGYLFLKEALGAGAEARFVSAEPLIEEYLDTRIPEEWEHYRGMVALTDAIVKEALSSAVVVPGRTTVGDVRRWLYDKVGSLGVGTWFQPDLRVQRQGGLGTTSRGFLAVAKESVVIERGDLIHVDFGISHLGLHTDWQKMAYVLREGETDAPVGLKNALANTHALQDVLMLKASRPGRSSADVFHETMTEMGARGIQADVYSHPLGNQGHALGASIDFRSANRKEAPKPLREGSYIAIELSTTTPVPEWGGQKVAVMEEDPAYLTAEGWKFFVPRQEAFYLIR